MVNTLRNSLGLATSIFVISVVLHFQWEMLQIIAYNVDDDPINKIVFDHFICANVEGVIMLGMYGVGCLFRRNYFWIGRIRIQDSLMIVVLGLFIGVAIEIMALQSGRWEYSQFMPVVPNLEVGILPILQLITLPFLVFWVATRVYRHPRLETLSG